MADKAQHRKLSLQSGTTSSGVVWNHVVLSAVDLLGPSSTSALALKRHDFWGQEIGRLQNGARGLYGCLWLRASTCGTVESAHECDADL